MNNLVTFVLLYLTSCSYWVEKITYEKKEQTFLLKKRTAPNFCQAKKNHQKILAGSELKTHKLYQEMLKSLKEQGTRLSPIDQFVLWTFVQMNVAPHKSSPFARLQVLIQKGAKTFYYDFFDHENRQTPVSLIGLENLLRSFKSRYNLYELASLYKNHLVSKLTVDHQLAYFLNQQKEALEQHSFSRKFFFRGTQILRASERLPKIDFVSIIRQMKKRKYSSIKKVKKLYPLQYDQNREISCNFDIKLYQNNFVFIRKKLIRSHLYSFSKNRFNAIAAMTLSDPRLTEYGHQALFQSQENSDNAAFCSLKVRKKRYLSVLTDTRDNAQVLQKILKKIAKKDLSHQSILASIKSPRAIQLKNPKRLLSETYDQKENNAEYFSNGLGKLWGILIDQDRTHYVDSRGHTEFTCPN